MMFTNLCRPQPTYPSRIPKEFRINAKFLYLTYPRCEVLPSEVVKNLSFLRMEVQTAVVVRENHEDGFPHLHVLLESPKRFNVRGANTLDVLTGQHGNYQAGRKATAILEYLMKAVIDLATVPPDLNLDSYYQSLKIRRGGGDAKNQKMAAVGLQILEGVSIQTIVKENPGLGLIHLPKMRGLEAYVRTLNAVPTRSPKEITPYEGDRQDLRQISDWLFDFMRGETDVTSLYLIGATNIGKTYFFRQLLKFFKIYSVPLTEDFYDSYNDDFDLCVFEEFDGQKPVSWLTPFLDGTPSYLRVKGGQYFKTRRIPCIFTANRDIYQIYTGVKEKNPELMAGLRRRLTEVYCLDRIDFPWYQSLETVGRRKYL